MKLSFSTRGWWQEGWEELVSTATEIQFQGIEIYNVLRHPELIGKGGPFHNRSEKSTACAGVVLEDKSAGCHAPVLYDTENKSVIYTPIYYYIGHFSKYICRGAKRVATTKYTKNIQAIAFKQTGKYIPYQRDLLTVLSDEDKVICETFLNLKNGGDIRFDAMSEALFNWAKKHIK